VDDPQGEGRVKVRYPWMPGNNEGYWAPVATTMAGGGRGTWFMPEDNDEVLIAFDQGDVRHPYIIGYLWNGEDEPPSNDRNLRLIRTVNGHEIALYDPSISGGDTGYIRIRDAHGNQIELSNANITIQSVGTITINAPTVIINGRPVAPAPRPI
jgi:uncharacterized protein involved in type VI secretion and phage assembly